MKKIIPYKTFRNALVSLDNGGRFYNLLTKANDGQVSSAELAKVAGVFNDKQKMVLYLEMSLSYLDEPSRKSIHASLSDDLKKSYKKYSPQRMLPSQAQKAGKLKSNAIITGVPRFVDAKSEFTGFIMVPIMAGKVMTFVMIPIIDQYDVYELRDDLISKEFIIAHARGKVKLPEAEIRCGGIIKELKADKKEKSKATKFLEAMYYTPL